MNLHRMKITALIVAGLLACSGGAAWADRGWNSGSGKSDHNQSRSGYYKDARYQHNRYYPRSGHVYKSVPRGYRTVVHHRTKYYYSGGIWYRPSGVYFSVVVPPAGAVVPVLPPYYTTVWYGASPYYYAGGVYYTWYPQQQGYMVTEPPTEGRMTVEPEVPEQLFIYPKLGQSTDRQSADRYECHRWAVDQSGFDPTQPGGNVPENQNTAKRADYNRATRACLEARNYSVQ